MKTILGLSTFFMISAVNSAEHNLSGMILRYPGFLNEKVYLNIVFDRVVVADVWRTPQKDDFNCTEDCNLEIIYDIDDTVFYNFDTLKFVHKQKTYNIAFTSKKYIHKDCSEIEDCNYYFLPFEIKFTSRE
ncbi:hypothetical protein BB559_004894 [Furculomyces boomerangus]|uniref:Uncharacterized protein n=1 Tax=Furculomyces boomerangus TaxID=61424 RepID=A0A2T9YC26_9FUNG|nr:hypothetical protein BB559_004894 [Furculomyces boomerangus]